MSFIKTWAAAVVGHYNGLDGPICDLASTIWSNMQNYEMIKEQTTHCNNYHNKEFYEAKLKVPLNMKKYTMTARG